VLLLAGSPKGYLFRRLGLGGDLRTRGEAYGESVEVGVAVTVAAALPRVVRANRRAPPGGSVAEGGRSGSGEAAEVFVVQVVDTRIWWIAWWAGWFEV
jgi:hypothetical protein